MTEADTAFNELLALCAKPEMNEAAIRNALSEARRDYDVRLELSFSKNSIASLAEKRTIAKVSDFEAAIKLIASTLSSQEAWAVQIVHSIKSRPVEGESVHAMSNWANVTQKLAAEKLSERLPMDLANWLQDIKLDARTNPSGEAAESLTAMEWLAGIELPRLYERFSTSAKTTVIPKTRRGGTGDVGVVRFVRLAMTVVDLKPPSANSVATHISQATLKTKASRIRQSQVRRS